MGSLGSSVVVSEVSDEVVVLSSVLPVSASAEVVLLLSSSPAEDVVPSEVDEPSSVLVDVWSSCCVYYELSSSSSEAVEVSVELVSEVV